MRSLNPVRMPSRECDKAGITFNTREIPGRAALYLLEIDLKEL